ncbi:MAG: alpha-1,2-fucosyltransferase [Lachnospiraceae bacterium]|nr:alpha-1,2-fucosyltransferase [Lachnospiraceae bacterium]
MIIVHVMGGLGNQLYQYAMYEKLKSMGKAVKLDTHAYTTQNENDKEWRKLELEWLEGLSYEVCSEDERTAFLDNSMSMPNRIRRKLFGRKNHTVSEEKMYMPEIYEMDDVYLYGYWACEKYYEDMIPVLQSKIRFPKSDDIRNQQCMEQMQRTESVSIHIRRTDYLSVADGARYMGICTDAYYDAAIEYMRSHLHNPQFYIFSDDIAYVREHYRGEDMHIVDWNIGENSMYDMQLMSMCKHNICANSTFSIWGARLNQNHDKLMIRPLRHDNYETVPAEQMQEYWKQWILMDSNGRLV